MSDRLMPGWVAITDKEGDTVHIAPGVTYHPNSDMPYQGGKQGAIIAVIQVRKKDESPIDTVSRLGMEQEALEGDPSKQRPHIRATRTTERVGGILWRRLPEAVVDDGEGGYWIPERNVTDCGEAKRVNQHE